MAVFSVSSSSKHIQSGCMFMHILLLMPKLWAVVNTPGIASILPQANPDMSFLGNGQGLGSVLPTI